jgi:hypothetical protein
VLFSKALHLVFSHDAKIISSALLFNVNNGLGIKSVTFEILVTRRLAYDIGSAKAYDAQRSK